MRIWTIGHSTRTIDEFISLLKANEIKVLADVRSWPGSKRYPHFDKDALTESLTAHGIRYEHFPELGGKRKPNPDSHNTAWRNASFRGYADYMQTPEFARAVDELVGLAKEKRVAIMCAEAVPWRCHRSLIGDALLARNIDVEDIMSENSVKPHRLTPWAKVDGAGVSYPGPPEQ